MNQQQFQNILQQAPNFTDKKSSYLNVALSKRNLVEQIIQEIEQRLVHNPECPHSHSSIINHHGKADNKNCERSFVATTKTPLARLRHKNKWHDYFQCMLEGKVFKVIVKQLTIYLKSLFTGVTAFYFGIRHKSKNYGGDY